MEGRGCTVLAPNGAEKLRLDVAAVWVIKHGEHLNTTLPITRAQRLRLVTINGSCPLRITLVAVLFLLFSVAPSSPQSTGSPLEEQLDRARHEKSIQARTQAEEARAVRELLITRERERLETERIEKERNEAERAAQALRLQQERENAARQALLKEQEVAKAEQQRLEKERFDRERSAAEAFRLRDTVVKERSAQARAAAERFQAAEESRMRRDIETLTKLATAVASNPALATVPLPSGSPELVRFTQEQLVRTGCFAGPVDGRPTRETWAALQRFQELGGLRLGPAPFSEDALRQLREQKGRVCPLECRAGETPAGDRCVGPPPGSVSK